MLKYQMSEYCRNTEVYAKKYYTCLLNNDFRKIRNLKDTVRPNALQALSCLAKYLDIYENFKMFVKKLQSKWSCRKANFRNYKIEELRCDQHQI